MVMETIIRLPKRSAGTTPSRLFAYSRELEKREREWGENGVSG